MISKSLLTTSQIINLTISQCRRQISSTTASITKIHRSVYARTYPTIVVQPDGSSINIKYSEPRKIIKLPLDLSQLSDAERKARIDRRKPRQKIIIQEELEDNFRSDKYLQFIKK